MPKDLSWERLGDEDVVRRFLLLGERCSRAVDLLVREVARLRDASEDEVADSWRRLWLVEGPDGSLTSSEIDPVWVAVVQRMLQVSSL